MNALGPLAAYALLFVFVVGLCISLYRLGVRNGDKLAVERLHRWLAEEAEKARGKAIDAHDKAMKENEDIL